MGRRTRELMLAAAICGGFGWALYAPVRRAYVLDPAMRRAIHRLDAETVAQLAAEGADVNLRLPWSNGGYPLNTPLRAAIAVGNTEALQTLISRGATVHSADPQEPTPLLHAVAVGVSGSVEILLKAGADPNAPEPFGDPPLTQAVEVAQPAGEDEALAMVQALLRHGANPHTLAHDGFTALALAQSQGWRQLARALKKTGSPDLRACAERIAAGGPLQAVRSGHLEPVELLVRRKVSFRTRDARGTPLTEAAASPNPKLLPYLLKHARGLDREFLNQSGPSGGALTLAADLRRWEHVKLLLAAGSHPDLSDRRKRSALHFAAQWGEVKIVPFLLAAGASVNARDREGRTPLDYAKDFRQIAMIRSLREAGANEQATDMRSRRAHEALQRR